MLFPQQSATGKHSVLKVRGEKILVDYVSCHPTPRVFRVRPVPIYYISNEKK